MAPGRTGFACKRRGRIVKIRHADFIAGGGGAIYKTKKTIGAGACTDLKCRGGTGGADTDATGSCQGYALCGALIGSKIQASVSINTPISPVAGLAGSALCSIVAHGKSADSSVCRITIGRSS